jgi:DNA-binding NarL/FixJ family response regulator
MQQIQEAVFDSTTFTNREWKVIQLLGEGLHNRDISRHLGLEEHYLKRLLRTVYHKTGMDRLNIALWYLKHEYEKNIH